MSMFWGYGHYFIFAAAAAVGAGLGVAVDHAAGHAEISSRAAGYAIAVPVAVYLFCVWLLHVRPHQRGLLLAIVPVAAVLALLTPLAPAPLELLAGVVVVLVAVNGVLSRRISDPVAAAEH
jgi:hypothetical protein